jgi:hypothetical protein
MEMEKTLMDDNEKVIASLGLLEVDEGQNKVWGLNFLFFFVLCHFFFVFCISMFFFSKFYVTICVSSCILNCSWWL